MPKGPPPLFLDACGVQRPVLNACGVQATACRVLFKVGVVIFYYSRNYNLR